MPIHNSVRSRTQNPYKLFLRLALLPLAILLLSACYVDRAGTNWPTDVVPPNVCPGDSVTLSWNGGAASVRPPITVSISSDPYMVDLAGTAFGPEGTLEAGPIWRSTSFTFTRMGGSHDVPAHMHSVNMISDRRDSHLYIDFPSTCVGSGAAWEDVDLSVPNFRSERVRLASICNFSGNDVRLHLTLTTGDLLAWNLPNGNCTEELPPESGLKVLKANVSARILSPVECDTTTSLPPPITLLANLTCDPMTTIAPLVAATEAPSTDETNQPGIIYLESLTPTTTTTSTPLGGLTFDLPGISLDHFYYGQGNCLPTSLNLQASISNPSQVSDMLLFFHLQDKVSGGTTPWSDPVIMTPLGAGEYEYNLASTAIPGYASYPEAWLLYQFVATKSDGSVLLRSDVFSNVSLMVCGK